jgi:tetratricopeptide (TPR) repeat protein
MSGLQSLRALINVMHSEERATMRNFLTSFDSRGERFNSKSVKLFDLLSESPDGMSEREVEFFIYGKRSTAAFSRLLIRFRDKLLESLFLDVNIHRESSYSPQFRYLFDVRKRTSYAQVLIGRGQQELAFFLYDACIEHCEKYEYYDEILILYRLKMQAISLSGSSAELEKLYNSYLVHERCRQAVFAAQMDYFRLINTKALHAKGKISEEQIQHTLKRLRSDYQETGSATVAHYWYYIEAEYLQLNGRFREARKLLQRQATLIEKTPALHVPYWLGIALFNQGENELFMHQFDRCVDFCQRAHPMLKRGSINEYQCLETEFYGHFYASRYSAAREILRDLLERDTGKAAAFREGKRQFLLACILFMQGLYRESQELLLELNTVESDRDGWNMGIRLLTIMADIERTLHDQASKRIENVRKHLKRLDQVHLLRRRDTLIYEILRALENASFDFRAVYQNMTSHFDLLRSNDPECRWQVKSPEMVIFHDWFFAHVIHSKYIQKIPKYIDPTAG